MSEELALENPPRAARRRLGLLIPVVVFLALAVFLGIGLFNDPREIPSPLIGKSVPDFELPPVKGRTLGLASGNLRGEVSMVNVFASWCTSCRLEHPVFMELKRSGVIPIHGLNYKDRPDDAAAWLAELGDPYTRTGADIDGKVSIDWGVYGVPETFLIGPDGRIAYKQIGPLTPKIWKEEMLPLIRKLRGESPPAS